MGGEGEGQNNLARLNRPRNGNSKCNGTCTCNDNKNLIVICEAHLLVQLRPFKDKTEGVFLFVPLKRMKRIVVPKLACNDASTPK